MKVKIVLLSIVCSCLLCNCTEEDSFVIPEEKLIDVDLSENFFTQKNIDDLREAKVRFDEFVYKDNNGDYKTLLESGEEIGITESTFEYLVECLSLRRLADEIGEKIQMRRQLKDAKSSPVLDPFEYYVLGQLAGMWACFTSGIKVTSEILVEVALMVADFCYVAVAVMLEFCLSIFTGTASPQFIVPPFSDYPFPMDELAMDGQYLGPTNAMDGIYAYPNYTPDYSSYPWYYILIDNGNVWGFYCLNHPYSMYRNHPQFFRTEHAYLVQSF